MLPLDRTSELEEVIRAERLIDSFTFTQTRGKRNEEMSKLILLQKLITMLINEKGQNRFRMTGIQGTFL